MSAAREPLKRIREILSACSDEAEIARRVDLLRGDPRAGARALARAYERRLESRRRERARLGRLCARTRELVASGFRRVAGVDEVGVGPLAGPVVAAAVVLPPPDRLDLERLAGLDDSKRLSREARERLAAAIHVEAEAIGIGCVEPEEIDRLNIHRAALEAMRRAVAALPGPPDHLLVDARRIPGVDCPQMGIVGGDAREAPIAAASIVAKVHRDALMCRIDARFPGYGFARHMGYGTPEHVQALRALGACPVHRRSFAPVAAVLPR